DDPVVPIRQKLHGIGTILFRRRHRHLQFDRSLSFVIDLLTDSRQRCHGIKQTPATRRQRRIYTLLHHAQQKVNFAPIELANERNVELQKLAPKMLCQVTDRHPPWFADRSRSAWQRHILEMRGALKVLISGDEHFSAPNFSVGAIASPIQREPDYAAVKMILRHATGDVSVVVLHAHQFHSALCECPPRGKVVRMKVVGDNLRTNFEDAFKMLDRLVKKTVALDIL